MAAVGGGGLGRPTERATEDRRLCFLQGKQKYTLPLYHAMMGGSEMARTLAKDTFAATASQLHSNVVNYVQQILVSKDS